MVVGTSTGWTKTLSLVGVGYRASVSGTKLVLNLGYSHPIEMDFPKGVTVAVRLPVLGSSHSCLLCRGYKLGTVALKTTKSAICFGPSTSLVYP